LLFLEVTNPTHVDLELSRIQFELRALPHFATSGDVLLSRPLGPGSTAVVEVPVNVNSNQRSALSGVPYTLTGRIFAREDRLEHSWRVKASGSLDTRGASQPLRTRIAGGAEDTQP
jgi:hypothetical protein